MRARPVVITLAILSIVVTLLLGTTGRLTAQAATAISGSVSSQEEGPMEGVVVTARRDGANFTVSVSSDAQGRYSFPRTHLQPGKYAVTIRAAGYDLASPGAVEVTAAKPATLDLKLQTAKDLVEQMTSMELANSMPGPQDMKDRMVYQLLSCAYCHTYNRIVKSKHNAEQFMPVITRMHTYYPDGAASSRDGRGRAVLWDAAFRKRFSEEPNWGFDSPFPGQPTGVPKKELAIYLASINLSEGKSQLSYELKPLPRPKGKSTRVIITQWDMPTRGTVPHDMDVDSKGIVWYTDESAQMLGRLDPKTNEFTEIAMPPVPKGDVPGTRDVLVDQEDNVWYPMRVAGGAAPLTKYDPKTGKITIVKELNGQFINMGADGKIWAGSMRIDPKTMKIDGPFGYNKAPNLPPGPHGGYGGPQIDSKGNAWTPDRQGGYMINVDVKTGQARFLPFPTLKGSGARRGKMDSQDRYWWGEYFADRIGMFDTRTEKLQQWQLPKYSTPYTSSIPDKLGRVYAPSNMSERLYRLDPTTSEIVDYLMPTDFDTKKIAYDPTAKNISLLMANTRNARIVRVEPLD